MYEIKAAYRKLVLRYHPDKNMSVQDVEKFKLITEAYGILRSNHLIPSPNSKVGGKQYCQDNMRSKMPYWGELNLERFIKERLFDLRHAEKTYRKFCKYEQESWRYCEKIARIAATAMFSSIETGLKVESLHALYGHTLSLKRGLKNVKSMLQI